MANRKVQGSKTKAQAPVGIGSLWLAGVGAVSLARKHGEGLLGDLVDEGRRLQSEASEFVTDTRSTAQARIVAVIKPLRARIKQQVEKTGAAIQSGIAGVLSRLGIPSKADIDDLAQRVGALSRQLKAGK
jgi:poly(hydroxyalkanoate) granule-associated protein